MIADLTIEIFYQILKLFLSCRQPQKLENLKNTLIKQYFLGFSYLQLQVIAWLRRASIVAVSFYMETSGLNTQSAATRFNQL